MSRIDPFLLDFLSVHIFRMSRWDCKFPILSQIVLSIGHTLVVYRKT